MSRPFRSALVALVAIGLSALASSASAGEGSVQIRDVAAERPPDVHLVVRVLDAAGNFVPGISPDAFDVFVDGERVDEVEVRQAHPGEEPVALSILIDTSGSMLGEPLEAGIDGAKIVLGALAPEDQVQVVGFGAEIDEVIAFGDEPDPSLLDDLEAEGNTPLHDALSEAVTALEERDDVSERAVVVLTDGRDDGSETAFEDLRSQVASAGVPIHGIGLESPEFEAGPLEELSDASGGEYREAASAGELRDIYQSIAADLRTEYRLSFTTDLRTGDHGVTVVVESDEINGSADAGFQLASAPEPEESESSTLPLVIIGLVVLLALGLTLALAFRRRSGSSPTPSRPVPGAAAGHMLVSGNGQFPLVASGTVVGRDPRAQIVIDEPSVSRTHARFDLDAQGVWVEDLGAANGTRVNGAPVTRQLLQTGDVILLGNVQLELRATQ